MEDVEVPAEPTPGRGVWPKVAVAVLLVALAAWLWASTRSGDSAYERRETEATPTTGAERERTMFGCLIVPYEEVETAEDQFAGVTLVEPYCTDAALLEERCGVPRASLLVPPAEAPMDGALSSTYSTVDGAVAGSFLVYTGVGGPPGIASTLICNDGTSVNFTAEDWQRFNSSAAVRSRPEASTTSVPTTRSPTQPRILPPALTPSQVALCSEPLVETANGNADPIFCADGSLNEDAWIHLATNDPTLFQIGPDASFDEVTRAICADRQVSTNSITDSTYRLAEAYFGWQFDEDPTVVMYAEEGCP